MAQPRENAHDGPASRERTRWPSLARTHTMAQPRENAHDGPASRERTRLAKTHTMAKPRENTREARLSSRSFVAGATHSRRAFASLSRHQSRRRLANHSRVSRNDFFATYRISTSNLSYRRFFLVELEFRS